jgi:hypothetical protein
MQQKTKILTKNFHEATQMHAEFFAEKIIENYNLTSMINDTKNVLEIKKELMQKYHMCEHLLDDHFVSELNTGDPEKISQRLWEIIVATYLLRNKNIVMSVHKNEGPDWKIKIGDKEYYVEATCTGFLKSNNTKKTEIPQRISGAIMEKIKRHRALASKECIGYILCVSYANLLPFGGDHYHAIGLVIPFGSFSADIDKENMCMKNQHFTYQDHFFNHNDSPIQTNILEEEKWISAILFSRVSPFLLLESSELIPYISWKECKNDFVIIHNENSSLPLKEDIFGCATKLKYSGDQLQVSGMKIFPEF